LRWQYVDIERSCLRLADSKTGAKVVPLGSAVLDIVAKLGRRSEYVLPARRGEGHYVGLQKDWEAVRQRAELPGLRIHDLRHSFASFAVASGVSLYITGKLLGHKQARTTAGYAHFDSHPLQRAVETTSRRIARAMGKPLRGG
jgi:integrase